MAIILEGVTRCPICEGTDLTRPYLATSGGCFPEEDELWRFCDAPLHLDCLAQWPHRECFARGYFDLWRDESLRGNGVLLAEGEGWLLRCGPAMPKSEPYYVAAHLSAWPIRLYSRWAQWAEYAASGYREGLSGEALEAADLVMLAIRDVAPTLEALAALRHELLRRLPPHQ